MLLKEAIHKVRRVYPGIRLFTIGITDVSDDWFESIEVPVDRKTIHILCPLGKRCSCDHGFSGGTAHG